MHHAQFVLQHITTPHFTLSDCK